MARYKGLMLVLDGVGDRPSDRLGGLTPLEVAQTPNLDRLAQLGMTGFVSPLHPWVPVGTQTGLGLLMGLARADMKWLSRGPVEAAGAGLKLQVGDVALRCNLATLIPRSEGFAITDRRAGRISVDVPELLETLNGSHLSDGAQVFVAQSTHHRAVAVLRGEGLAPEVSDTDPGAGKIDLGVLTSKPIADGGPAARTARLVNELVAASFEKLSRHPINLARVDAGLPPANGLITRGAGGVFECRNLIRHLQLKAAVVTGEGTAVGLANVFGFTVITNPRFTAGVDTDLSGKVQASLDALESHDFVMLHIKGPDVASHDLDPEAKRDMLERIDTAIAPLLEMDLVVAVTGDHSTDSNSGRHCGDPVPAVVAGPNIRSDVSSAYSEAGCQKGGLGHISATSFLCACLDVMNVMNNHRAYEYFFYE